MIAVVCLEHVLVDGDDLKENTATRWGRPLYQALHSQFRIIGFTAAEHEIARWWTRKESMSDWAALMSKEDYLDYATWKVEQVRQFLAEGWEVGLVIDTDPAVLVGVNRLGVLGLTMTMPMQRVGFRAQQAEPQPWNELVSERYPGG